MSGNLKRALSKGRQASQKASNAVDNAKKQVKSALSFGKKVKKHWVIVFVALVFDFTVGLVPFINFFGNAVFGFVLYLKFGPKKNIKGADNLLGIVMPILFGSALDFIFDVIPVNVGAALIRIFMSNDES